MPKISSFALVLIVAISLSSCSDKTANLVNTWRIDEIKPTKPNPQIENFVHAQLPLMKYMQRITYNADGTSIETTGGKPMKGSWEMSKDGKTMYATNERATSRYLNTQISKDKFSYMMVYGPDTLVFTFVPFSAKDTLNKPVMPQMQPQAGAQQGQPDESPDAKTKEDAARAAKEAADKAVKK